ncbi:MAG: twin-arginine translocase subunit TatC [Ignavibacteriae bacterium]
MVRIFATMSDTPDTEHKEMSFLGHLEELRSRAFKAIIWVLIGSAITAYFREWIMNELLLKPATDAGINLQNLEPFGQAFLLFKVIFFAGLILSFPMVIYQVWSFIAPGLYVHERRWARWVTLLTTFCFLLGVAFAYFLMIPSMMNYINVVANPNIEDNISTSAYFSFFVNMLLASGLIFELPMVTWVLSKVGMVSSKLMSKYRRHSIVAILIIAAVVTPTPDPVTQIMVAIPLYILYEISVVISYYTNPRSREA